MKIKKVAAIDIGSSSIRMSIAEINEKKEIEILEDLRQPIRLGKDSFYKGKIFRNTIDECIQILIKYKQLCEEYGVEEIKAVATTAVRESSNADIFIDNIATYTGLQVEIISANRETEYVHRTLIKKLSDFEYTNYRCIAEVGAGSVEITVFDKDFILYSTTLPIGALKSKQLFTKEYSQQEDSFANYLKIIVEHELRVLVKMIPVKDIMRIYGVGAELEEAAHILKKDCETNFFRLNKNELEQLCLEIEQYSIDEIIHKLNVSNDLAENFYAISRIFLSIIKFLECEEIYIPDLTLKDCIITDMTESFSGASNRSLLEKQIIINSQNIGRTFNYDEPHALKVLQLSIKLFNKTQKIHRLEERNRCLLIASAILHDVGLAISNRNHHKHSQYIVKTQNFYYFTEDDRRIISNVVRYHRKSVPKPTHNEYISMSKKSRMITCKLAAILRIADSLDNHHLQLVEDIEVKIKKKSLLIIATVKDNIYAEIYSFNVKKDLFEEFFGFNVTLETKNTNAVL